MAACLFSLTLTACGAAPSPAPDPGHAARVEALARPVVEAEHAAALAIGLVTPNGNEIHTFGVAAPPAEAPHGGTTFEIGSVTKVFTALALALAIERGEVTPETTVDALLPCPAPPLKLVDLASHTAGLPRLPPNFAPADRADPYADYDGTKLCAALATLTPAAGAYDYSNLGAGLLGHALAAKAGAAYPDLVRDRIAAPLGLPSVSAADPAARGHDADGRPVPPWHLDALAGAGALRASAADLVRFVEANLRPPEGPLGAALRATHAPRADRRGGRIGLGWHIGLGADPEVRWHNGATAGASSFVAFDAAAGVGVVVLANQSTPLTDALGAALLDMLRGRPYALDVPKTVAVDEAALEGYVGEYAADVGGQPLVFTVTRDGPRLSVQLTGQPAFRVYAESPTRFRYRVVEAAITFEPGALVLHQGGRDLRAVRR